jgi:hypothetical protein
MKKIFFLIIFSLVASVSFAQEEEEEPVKEGGFDKSRLFFGGNLGANFGDYTLVNISPQLGYRFSDFVAAGAGVNFIYNSLKYRDFNNNPIYRDSYTITGLNIFGRVYPIRQIMLQVQPELNYVWGKQKSYNGEPDVRVAPKFVPSLLVGGGAAIPTGRGAFIAMLQYDVLQNGIPYGTRPFLSFGYNMGF